MVAGRSENGHPNRHIGLRPRDIGAMMTTMRPMADVQIAHVFECDEDTFWNRIFLDDSFNERLYRQHLGFTGWSVLSRDETDTSIRRVVEATPPVGDVPGPLKKILGGTIRYREEGDFDKKRRVYRVKVVPGSLADKLTIGGQVTCEAVADKQCRRVFNAHVEARVFGVGGLLEKRIISDLQTSYDRAAHFTREHLATLRSGD